MLNIPKLNHQMLIAIFLDYAQVQSWYGLFNMTKFDTGC